MRFLAVCFVVLAASLSVSAADETTPPKPRIVFLLSGDALAAGAEKTTEVLKLRLTTLELAPRIAPGDAGLAVEIDQPGDLDAIGPVLTAPGVFAVHAAGDIVKTCPATLPGGMICMPTIEPRAPFLIVAAEPALSGDVLDRAVPIAGEGVVPQVAITMTAQASQVFAQFTRAMKDRRIAIVVDGRVITAPVIKSPITSGAGVLAGPGIPSAIWAAILTHPPMPGSLEVLSVNAVPAR